jgi:hypothetical protein
VNSKSSWAHFDELAVLIYKGFHLFGVDQVTVILRSFQQLYEFVPTIIERPRCVLAGISEEVGVFLFHFGPLVARLLDQNMVVVCL